MRADILFNWKDCESCMGQVYSFPQNPTSHMKQYAQPGIYRWAIFCSEHLEAVYIGEAEDLARRLRGYICPGKGQKTNIRIKAHLDDYLKLGMLVKFQFLRFENFIINGHSFVCSDMNDPFARKIVENLAILDATRLDCKVLNKGTNLVQKKIESVYQSVSKWTIEQRGEVTNRLASLSDPNKAPKGE